MVNAQCTFAKTGLRGGDAPRDFGFTADPYLGLVSHSYPIGPTVPTITMPTLLWRLSIRASNEAKAQRVWRRVEHRLNCRCRLLSCSPDGEDSAFWDTRFETSVDGSGGSGPAIVWHCLTLAGRLVPSGWSVSIPRQYPNGTVTFSGLWAGTSGCCVTGVEWAHFDLVNTDDV